MTPFLINPEICTGCGLCAKQCSRSKIQKKNNFFVVADNDDCIACGHCYAVCPVGAIQVENYELEKIPPLSIDSDSLLFFLRTRRSHRKYQEKPIPETIMQKLVEFARFAPTGTNSQAVRYLFIKDPQIIDNIRKETMRIYRIFYRILKNPLIRFLGGLLDKRLRKKELFRDLKRMIDRYYEKNEDPLFHNAPLLVFLYCKKEEASTPYDDCCYAALQMVLGAETLGLVSCLNGLVMIGLRFSKKIKNMLGFKGSLKPYVCIGFGYPVYQYHFLVGREKPDIKIL